MKRTMPSPRLDLMSALDAAVLLLPPHAGKPKSGVSRNRARGRFLCDRETIFRRSPPLNSSSYRAASVAVVAIKTPWNV